MQHIVTVDGGTSKTRVYLWSTDGKILAVKEKNIGAKDSATHGTTEIWKNSIRDMILEICRENGVAEDDLAGVYMSGMLTSNLGIMEIPHKEAPISMNHFQKQVIKMKIPDICKTEITFVPGIKNSVPKNQLLDNYRTFDMMRGEETETYALVTKYGIGKDTIFVLPGSHNKYVYINKEGTVLGTLTTLSGELLEAIIRNTIVSDSVEGKFLDLTDYNLEMIRYGCRMYREEGIGRALFLTRIFGQFAKKSSSELQNYVLGVVIASDVTAVKNAHYFPQNEEVRVIIYGKNSFCHAFYDLLNEEKIFDEILLDCNTEMPAAAVGAYEIAGEISKR